MAREYMKTCIDSDRRLVWGQGKNGSGEFGIRSSELGEMGESLAPDAPEAPFAPKCPKTSPKRSTHGTIGT